MDRETFKRLITSQHLLAPHADFLLDLLKPCVRIDISPNGPNGTQSQLGGKPMVPANFDWPQHAVGLYRFLGQINFAEITERPACLPETGLLSLFYAEYDPESDSQEEIFWGEDDYVKAWYFDDMTALAPMAPPRGKAAKARRITLTGDLDMLRDSYMLEEWPFDFEVLNTLLDESEATGNQPTRDALLPTDYMLGYPSHYSLAYNPTPSPNWISLLTLHSHDTFEWCWQDGNKLMVFIEQDKLEARDFSTLKCDAG